MSSAIQPSYAPSSAPSHQQSIHHGSHGSISVQHPGAPVGTFAPGTKVQVGGHRVMIERYLSEGGFAHVYLARLPKPVDGEETAVLKRVAVPDKEALTNMRTEVETMKKLKGYRHIVRYIDSHASQLKGGGYEVFLLMEYCAGGGLIDFMNTRLQNRLTESEILKIFSDVAQGVACMHYLKPPLLHRDLKVENVLISSNGSTKQFKLCDFGSTAPPRPAATTAAEGRLIEEDVQKHTTMQYRSPEMIDVYRKQPIDEKSDIWALGVLLYKLCYYTTPFEDLGQMAILNASFKYPAFPPFTDRLKKMIAMMLQENPRSRPNIYQVLREICSMRETEVPIRDIYTDRTASEARRNQELPSPPSKTTSPPIAGAYKSIVVEETPKIPDITPMRRGRPKNLATDHQPHPSSSPARPVNSDPFAALDSGSGSTNNIDEASARFPSLDQFSLLHDSGNKFAFDQKPPQPSGQTKDISQRVTEALADDAFALPPTTQEDLPTKSNSLSSIGKKAHAATQTFDLSQRPTDDRPVARPSKMVSTGTMTSPQAPANEIKIESLSSRPTFQFSSSNHRSSSQPRTFDSLAQGLLPEREWVLPTRPTLSDRRSQTQTATVAVAKPSTSSRPSLEGRRPQIAELDDLPPRVAPNTRSRPVSAHLESTARLLRARSPQNKNSDSTPTEKLLSNATGISDVGIEGTQIASNVDFLKAMEEEDPSKRKEKRNSSGSKHMKRTSLSLSGTKSMLAGRFGDAFKRFESNNTDTSNEHDAFPESNNLTPIAGSEATDGRSDDGQVLEETEDVPPEVRRELERRRLSQEERRVAEAAAAYKQQVADGTKSRGRESSRATLIQNKVQALLDESGKASPTKTAEGYGRFTESPRVDSALAPQLGSGLKSHQAGFPASRSVQPPLSSSSAPAVDRPFHRPSAPPKPQVLRTGGRGGPQAGLLSPTKAVKPNHLSSRSTHPQLDGATISPEDWEATFSKRYPSLSGLEMVETEIDKVPPNARGV